LWLCSNFFNKKYWGVYVTNSTQKTHKHTENTLKLGKNTRKYSQIGQKHPKIPQKHLKNGQKHPKTPQNRSKLPQNRPQIPKNTLKTRVFQPQSHCRPGQPARIRGPGAFFHRKNGRFLIGKWAFLGVFSYKMGVFSFKMGVFDGKMGVFGCFFI
jgi:hypothetical protein